MEELLQNIPQDEMKIVGGDLNGHVGRASDQNETCHGGLGYGTKNQEGQTILQFATIFELAILNIYFTKLEEHKITYKSGNNCSQIDYFLTDKKNIKIFSDCKVIPGESLTAQHRLLLTEFTMFEPAKTREKRKAQIKWKELTTPAGTEFLNDIENLLRGNGSHLTTDEIWQRFKIFTKNKATEYLGASKESVQEG